MSDPDPSAAPSVSRLAGQLEYLFEEQPELKVAPVAQLVARLNEEDRWAQAITRYPNRSDAATEAPVSTWTSRTSAPCLSGSTLVNTPRMNSDTSRAWSAS